MSISKTLSPLGRAVLVTVTYPLPTLLVIVLSNLFPSLPDVVLRCLICLLGTAMIVAYLILLDKKPLSALKIGLTKQAFKGFVLSLGLTALLVCLAYALSFLLGQIVYEPAPGLSLAGLSSAFMASFVLQGFPEELAFRAYLRQTLDKSPMVTLFWSAGLFSAIHVVHFFMNGWLWGLQTVFYAFAFGVLAFVLQEIFQTSWAAVAVHGGLHLTRFVWEMNGIYPDYDYLYGGLLMLLVSAYLIGHYSKTFKTSA